MPENNVLRWPDGAGWLVLSGGVAVESEIRALVLERSVVEGGVAYVSVDSPPDAAALEDMDDLGAPAGYAVDVLAEDDGSIRKALAEASTIVVEDTRSPEALLSGLKGAAVEGAQLAYERGAMILAEGCAAAVFGRWMSLQSGQIVQGLDWLHNTLLIPGVSSLGQSDAARNILAAEPMSIAVGVGSGSALALGPNGELELWGRRQVALALGSGYKN